MRPLSVARPAVGIDADAGQGKLNRPAPLAAAALEGAQRFAFAVRYRVRGALIAFRTHCRSPHRASRDATDNARSSDSSRLRASAAANTGAPSRTPASARSSTASTPWPMPIITISSAGCRGFQCAGQQQQGQRDAGIAAFGQHAFVTSRRLKSAGLRDAFRGSGTGGHGEMTHGVASYVRFRQQFRHHVSASAAAIHREPSAPRARSRNACPAHAIVVDEVAGHVRAASTVASAVGLEGPSRSAAAPSP